MSPRGRRPLVVKFGGRSLDDPAAAVARIRALRRGSRPVVVVVSARAGVTDRLEEWIAASAPAPQRARLLRALRALHRPAGPEVAHALARARATVAAARPSGGPDLDRADRVRALGERIAAAWLAERLRAAGLPARALEADRIGVATRAVGGGRRIDEAASRRPVRRALRPLLRAGVVPVVTGYFGRGSRGGPAVLGRGSSDYSATALGRILGATRVDLVKPDLGLRTADPRHLPGGAAVARLSYDEAEEAARLGARILHPRSVDPARRGRMELRIVGTHRAARPTRIGGAGTGGRTRIVVLEGPIAGAAVPARAAHPGPFGRLSVVGEGAADDPGRWPPRLDEEAIAASWSPRSVSWLLPWRTAARRAAELHAVVRARRSRRS